MKKDDIMEQSLGNNESHPTQISKQQTESEVIRSMLEDTLGIEWVKAFEGAFMSEDNICFQINTTDHEDWDDDFSDLPDEDADDLYDEGMEFLGLTGDEDEQGLSDSYWD